MSEERQETYTALEVYEILEVAYRHAREAGDSTGKESLLSQMTQVWQGIPVPQRKGQVSPDEWREWDDATISD